MLLTSSLSPRPESLKICLRFVYVCSVFVFLLMTEFDRPVETAIYGTCTISLYLLPFVLLSSEVFCSFTVIFQLKSKLIAPTRIRYTSPPPAPPPRGPPLPPPPTHSLAEVTLYRWRDVKIQELTATVCAPGYNHDHERLNRRVFRTASKCERRIRLWAFNVNCRNLEGYNKNLFQQMFVCSGEGYWRCGYFVRNIIVWLGFIVDGNNQIQKGCAGEKC